MHPKVYTRTVSHVRSPPASGQFSALPLLIAPKPIGLQVVVEWTAWLYLPLHHLPLLSSGNWLD